MRSITLNNIKHNLFHSIKGIFPQLGSFYLKYHLKKGTIMSYSDLENFMDLWDKVNVLIDRDINVGLVKIPDNADFPGYIELVQYWPRYERFLKYNIIPYSFYNIQLSTWQKEAEKYDVIIWSIYSSPHYLNDAKAKIYFLEKYMKKKCFPSYDEIWPYEDKVRNSYMFKHFNLPLIDTFVTHSKEEALSFINNTAFPIISKITTGSGSKGVIKLDNKKEAAKYIRTIFSEKGRKTYWQGLRQKDYIYLQKFVDDATFDLRVIVVGNKLLGYYRYPKEGDFRASGANKIVMKEIPEEAMRIAIKTTELFETAILAVDMVYSTRENKYYIIETSINIQVDNGEELIIDGKPGYYEFLDNKFTFKEGKFWIQELALEQFFKKIMIK